MLTYLAARKCLLPILFCAYATNACGSGTIDAIYSDLAIQTVQVVDAKGAAIGGRTQYVKLALASKQDLRKSSKGLLQLRAYVVLPNGDRLLTLGTATIAEKPLHFIPISRKSKEHTTDSNYSVFFFHNLILDYDGKFKIDLLKDTYDRIEFDVSDRIFAGPQLARSSMFSVTKADFLKLHAAKKDDTKAVFLMLD